MVSFELCNNPFLFEYGRILSKNAQVLDLVSSLNSNKYSILPGFCDVHVHFREPGFSYKETIKSGCAAAAHGGYTAVCTMPNLNPTPDCLEHLNAELALIDQDASIDVYPYGTITVGEQGKILSNFRELAPKVIAFSDDGKGIQSIELMKEAMALAKECGKMIVAHCEDNSLLNGGYIHSGHYASSHSHKGISSESEWKQIERDIKLVDETKCSYHVCHISTQESVSLIRDAKKSGIDVTCESAPHYLVLDDSFLVEDGRYKMNPPLRSAKDREALIEGVLDGTIDMIATDHAPHAFYEKDKGLRDSAFGIVGLETSFSVLYTELVCNGILSIQQLISLLSEKPKSRFLIEPNSDFSIWDLGNTCQIDARDFLSKGKATPFDGKTVRAKCLLTVHNGNIVYIDNSVEG